MKHITKEAFNSRIMKRYKNDLRDQSALIYKMNAVKRIPKLATGGYLKPDPNTILDNYLANKSIITFITALRNSDPYIQDIYLYGGCYQFHLLLKSIYPECEPRITRQKNHIVSYYKGNYYDITGQIQNRILYPLTPKDLEIVSNWSFRKHKAIQLCKCHVCEEPIVV